MLNARSTNQRALRRSRRNRRNLQQPQTPPANRRPPRIIFEPKLKYQNSFRDNDGVLILSTRKRGLITDEEKEERKRKKTAIAVRKISLIALRHEVVNLWKYGMHTEQFQFGPKASKQIISFLQFKYPAYAKRAAAKSFFYRALKRFKSAGETPELEPQRDRRGENKTRPKRDDPLIIELCDELLSAPKATVPKVKRQLQRLGHRISISTIHRIRIDLKYRWQKPWYTDVLTPAQKYKRKLFCAKLLRLSPAALLNAVGSWLFTDEKWWDIVGPAAYKYVKAATDAEGKNQNQVSFFYFCHFCHGQHAYFYFYFCHRQHSVRCRAIKAKKAA